jgi:purine catabolism regulator
VRPWSPGGRGCAARVACVGLLELNEAVELDELDDVRPDELLLVPAGALQASDDGRLGRLARCLAERSAAGLLVAPGRSAAAVPATLSTSADAVGLPVLALPPGTRLDAALEQLGTALRAGPVPEARPTGDHGRADDVHRALLQIVVEGGGLTEVAAGLVGLLGGAVVITTPDGRVLADAGTSPTSRVLTPRRASTRPAGCGRGRGRRPHRARRAPRQPRRRPDRGGAHDHGRIVAFSSRGSLGRGRGDGRARRHRRRARGDEAAGVRAVESKYQGDFLRDLLTGQVGPEVGVAHARASAGTSTVRSSSWSRNSTRSRAGSRRDAGGAAGR